MIWTLSDVLSTQLFNFHVSVVVWELPSATFVKLVHLSKAMKELLLGRSSYETFEDSFSYSNQLGQRQGAGVVYPNVFHPDIIAFLSTKKENADEKFV